MSLVIIKMEKEDINLGKIGYNFFTRTDKFDLIFSPEAIEQLISDYNVLKSDPKLGDDE